MKAIDVGKTVEIDAGKKLVEKAVEKLSKPKSQVATVMVLPEEITKKVIDGSSVNRSNASNAIAIQYLVRRVNESGLKVT